MILFLPKKAGSYFDEINLKMEKQGCKHMNHLSKKVLPGVILSLAIVISAYSFSTSSTPRRNGIYASAAQTTVS